MVCQAFQCTHVWVIKLPVGDQARLASYAVHKPHVVDDLLLAALHTPNADLRRHDIYHDNNKYRPVPAFAAVNEQAGVTPLPTCWDSNVVFAYIL